MIICRQMISRCLKHCIHILFGVKAHELVDLMQNSSFALRCLYPGLEGRFILENIKPSVMDSLKKAAKTRGNTFCFVDICVLSPHMLQCISKRGVASGAADG